MACDLKGASLRVQAHFLEVKMEKLLKEESEKLELLRNVYRAGRRPTDCLGIARRGLSDAVGALERHSLMEKYGAMAKYGYMAEGWEKQLIGYARDFLLILFYEYGLDREIHETNERLALLREKMETEGVCRDWGWLDKWRADMSRRLLTAPRSFKDAAKAGAWLRKQGNAMDTELENLKEGKPEQESLKCMVALFDKTVAGLVLIEKGLLLAKLEQYRLRELAVSVDKYISLLSGMEAEGGSFFWYGDGCMDSVIGIAGNA